MKRQTAFRAVTSLLTTLLLGAAALSVPVLAARQQEAALLRADRPRPAFGGVLWLEPVRGNPVLYALHRTVLQGNTALAYASGSAEPAAAAQTARGLLDTLHTAGVVDDGTFPALETLLDTATEASGSAKEGRFSAVYLRSADADRQTANDLTLVWHVDSGLPVSLYYGIAPGAAPAPDVDAALKAFLAMLGLDSLTDWAADDSGGRADPLTHRILRSEAGQVQVTAVSGPGMLSLRLETIG